MATKGQSPMAFSIWGLQGWVGGGALFLPTRTIPPDGTRFLKALGPAPRAPRNGGRWRGWTGRRAGIGGGAWIGAGPVWRLP
ncbi:MAG: hypothetical protein OXC57_06675 [Rhodobacteraceae bacterium]|nr:hypothetical protein [Paracoccaceae bacterium]